MKRTELLLFALLGAGCCEGSAEPTKPEVTSGTEVAPDAEAEGAPSATGKRPGVAMAIAAIEAEDVELVI